jgi:hypothetical protein
MLRRFLAMNLGAQEWICSVSLNLASQSLSQPQLTSLIKSLANLEGGELLRAVYMSISCENQQQQMGGVGL